MSEGHENSPAILHVTAGGSPPADLERWFASAPFLIDTAGDVYRGLARALAPTDRDLQAVIVGVDNLTSTEFEFFSILTRQRPNALVCIYGSESQRAEVKSLIRSDRIADLSCDGLDVLRRLAITSRIESRSVHVPPLANIEKSTQTREFLPPARTETPSQGPIVAVPVFNPAPPLRTTPDPKLSPIGAANRTEPPRPETDRAEPLHGSDESGTNGKDNQAAASISMPGRTERETIMDLRGDDEPEEYSPDSASDSTSPARVPWRIYSDAPPRVAPQRLAPRIDNAPPASLGSQVVPQNTGSVMPGGPPQSASSPRNAEPGRALSAQRQSFADDRYAPLLTPEELQALMADDEEVESLTIDETDALLSDEE